MIGPRVRSLRGVGSYVDLDQHAGPSQSRDHHERAGRGNDIAIDFGAAFVGFEKVSDVGDVSCDLVDVLERRPVLFQKPLDLVPGITALPAEVAEMADSATLRAGLVFGSDTAQVDDFARIAHDHDFGEPLFRPFGVVIALFLESAGTWLRFLHDMLGKALNCSILGLFRASMQTWRVKLQRTQGSALSRAVQ